MNQPLFPRRAARPMTEKSYRLAADRLRAYADSLEACAGKPEPQAEAIRVVNWLATYLNGLMRRLKL